MKKLIRLLIILSIISCSTKNEKDYQKPSSVIISGKVLNFNPKSPSVKILVNQIGFNTINLEANLDSEGNFLTTFKSYTPTDVWIRYKGDFLVLIHPGDSLYVEFDGNPQKRIDVFKSIKFGGKEAKINREAAIFQSRYYSHEFSDQNKRTIAIRDYNVAEFKNYLNTSQTSLNTLFEEFVKDINPDEETKIWAKEFLNSGFTMVLFYYPFVHQHYNKLKLDSLHLPDDYFAPILTSVVLI